MLEIIDITSGWPPAVGFWTLLSAGGLLLLTLFTSQMAASLNSIEAMLEETGSRDN